MKKLLLLLISAAAVNANAQGFKLISSSDNSCEFTYALKVSDDKSKTLENISYLDFSKMYNVVSLQKGAPALPVFHTSLQIPAKGSPVITIEYDDVVEIHGANVLPSKGNLKRNVNPADVAYTFGEAYQSNAFFPSSSASISEPFVWSTARGLTVSVSPYQYNPVTKTLHVHKNIRIKVDFNNEIAGLNETAVSVIDKKFATHQSKIFLNSSTDKYTAIDEEGSLLIIAPASYESTLQEFVDWKIMKGLPTEFVTTTATGSTTAQIKAFIQSYYGTHPDLMYVLLVGDSEQIPTYSYGMSEDDEQLYSDSYYGQLAGGTNDFHPEVFVGRLPAATTVQAEIMASRTIDYERNPAPGDWMQTAIGIGSNEGSGFGDDDEIDYQHIRNIRTKLMNYGYTTVHEFYQGSQGGNDSIGNPTSSMVGRAVNTGAGLINYTGHGDISKFVTSSYNISAVNNATNNGKYPFVISVACNNGSFAGSSCLGEAFLRSENNGTPAGGIAFAGSSILMAWAPPMQTQDEMTDILTGVYPDNYKETIGGLFYNAQLSMLEQYPDVDGNEVMQTWILFGDPSVGFRSKTALDLTANHVSQVSLGTSSLTVNCNVEGTLIAVSQSHELLGKAIVSGGQAVINFTALSQEIPLTVIGSKSNYSSYMGSVQVGNSTLSIANTNKFFNVYPNPARDQFTISSDITADYVEMYSLTGSKMDINAEQISGQIKVSTSNIAAGSYILKIGTANGIAIQRLEIIK